MGIHTTDNLIQHFISVLISLFHFDSEHWPYLPVLLQSSQSLHAYEAEVPHHQWTGQSSFLLAVALARSSSSLSVPSHVEVAAMEVRYLFLPSTDHTQGHQETWTNNLQHQQFTRAKKSLYKDYRFFFLCPCKCFLHAEIHFTAQVIETIKVYGHDEHLHVFQESSSAWCCKWHNIFHIHRSFPSELPVLPDSADEVCDGAPDSATGLRVTCLAVWSSLQSVYKYF